MINKDNFTEDERIKEVEDGRYAVTERGHSHSFTDEEIAIIILPYIRENLKVSNRKLEEITGLDRRRIGRVRKSDEFMYSLINETNKQMIEISGIALNELEKMISSPNTSPSVKQKAIATALQYRVNVLELYAKADKKLPEINVDELLNELDKLL